MTRFQRLVSSLVRGFLFAWLAAACAGPGGSEGEGREILVRLKDFKSGTSYELASESHTDRVAYYSGARGDAARKVQTDEIMSAFIGELERQGFESNAQPGKAPSTGAGGVLRWGLEIQRPEESTHWLVGTGSAPEDWNEFQRCRDTFLELYNITVSYQTVQNEGGRQIFDGQEARPATGNKPR